MRKESGLRFHFITLLLHFARSIYHLENRILANGGRIFDVILEQVSHDTVIQFLFREFDRGVLGVVIDSLFRLVHALVHFGPKGSGVGFCEATGFRIGHGIVVVFGIEDAFEQCKHRHEIMPTGVPSRVRCRSKEGDALW